MVVGCGGSSSGGSLGGQASAGGGTGSGSTSTLAGTWDFLGTQGTTMATGTLSIDAGSISVVANGGSLTLSRQGDALTLSYSDDVVTKTAMGQQSGGGTVSFGAIPFDLSGTVSLTEVPTDPDISAGTCGGTLTQSAITATCQKVGRPPRPAPRRLNGTLSATRSAPMSSIFGDLGGVWTGSGASGDSCTVTIQGNSVATSCTGGALAGSITMVFSGNVASGTTSAGIEFSAQRR